MRYLAWAWSILMIGGALGARAMALAIPHRLAVGMIAAGLAMLPTLWAEPHGLLAGTQLPGRARASFALVMLLVCGLAGTPFGVQGWYAMAPSPA